MFIVNRSDVFQNNFPPDIQFNSVGSLWCTFNGEEQKNKIEQAGFNVYTNLF